MMAVFIFVVLIFLTYLFYDKLEEKGGGDHIEEEDFEVEPKTASSRNSAARKRYRRMRRLSKPFTIISARVVAGRRIRQARVTLRMQPRKLISACSRLESPPRPWEGGKVRSKLPRLSSHSNTDSQHLS